MSTGAPLLHLLCAGAAQGVVEALEPRFRAATGASVRARFGAVGAMKEALLEGAACDVLVSTATLIDALAASGALRPGSAAPLGSVRTGIAVRGTAALPPLAGADDLRRALRAADRIYFPDPVRSTAGIHFSGVLKRLGLHDELAARFATFPNGATAMRELAASSAAVPIGCTQVTEILRTEGVRLAGTLPREFELVTVYAAALASGAADPALAQRFVAMVAGAASRDVRLAAGFELDGSTSFSPPTGAS